MDLREFVENLDEASFRALRKAVEKRATVEGTKLVAEEMDLLRAGHYTQAIKAFRYRTGASLREAKDYFDEIKKTL